MREQALRQDTLVDLVITQPKLVRVEVGEVWTVLNTELDKQFKEQCAFMLFKVLKEMLSNVLPWMTPGETETLQNQVNVVVGLSMSKSLDVRDALNPVPFVDAQPALAVAILAAYTRNISFAYQAVVDAWNLAGEEIFQSCEYVSWLRSSRASRIERNEIYVYYFLFTVLTYLT